MYRRLKKFLPIVVFALAVQIFAPIGACWAASIAASDPLAGAVICHGSPEAGSAYSDQTGPHSTRNGCCSVCTVLTTGAPVDAPQAGFVVKPDRDAAPAAWHAFSPELAASHGTSPPQARAPPLPFLI